MFFHTTGAASTACIRSGRPTLGRSTSPNLKSRCGPTRCPTRSGTRCAGVGPAHGVNDWQLRRALAEVATELGDLGIRTFNVNQIFEEMVRQAFDPAPIALTGYVVRDPDCEPVADPKLIAVAADGARTSAFADAQGVTVSMISIRASIRSWPKVQALRERLCRMWSWRIAAGAEYIASS